MNVQAVLFGIMIGIPISVEIGYITMVIHLSNAFTKHHFSISNPSTEL